jgi:peptidylamidoglycolate lyase
MRRLHFPVTFLFSSLPILPANFKNEEVMPQLYEQVTDWPKLPEGLLLGNPTGLSIDTSGNSFFSSRLPIMATRGTLTRHTHYRQYDLIIDPRSGKLLSSWGDHLFTMPHGLTVDHENNVWVTDCGLNQVMKFSHDGRLLLKLGEAGVAGHDSAHFNMPTAVAVARDGSFYVSDGYGNSRVAKFSGDGKFLFEWGVKERTEFPHGIVWTKKGMQRQIVKQRIQVSILPAISKQWSTRFHVFVQLIIMYAQQFLAVDDG